MAAPLGLADAVTLSTKLRPLAATPWNTRNARTPKTPSPLDRKKKATRVRHGKLKTLLSMPLEIFYEIVGWLTPLYLLHLARASKQLRSMFMSRGNSRLWKAARRNVPGLPDCPPVLAEPRYAAYVFDQYCFACGIERSTNVNYTLGLRFCAPCYKLNFLKGDSLGRAFYRSMNEDQRELLCPLLVAGYDEYLGRYRAATADPMENNSYCQYYVPEVEAVIQVLCDAQALDTSLQRLEAFMAQRRQYTEHMQTHGLAVVKWREQTLCDKEKTKANRKQDMIQRLKDLGYADADFPVNNTAWDKILNQPRELTERIWRTALPKLRALIDQERTDRERGAFEARLKERSSEIEPYYTNFVQRVPTDIRPFMPNLFDACRLPSLAELASTNDAHDEVTLTRFASVEGRLLAEVKAYIAQAKRDLVEMLHRERYRFVYHERDSAPMPDYTEDQLDTVLGKATALFVCHYCPLHNMLSASDICTHWRQEHPQLKWNDGWPPNEVQDMRRRRSEWPKRLPWISAMRKGEEEANSVLDGLGVREDVTHAELDALVRQGRLVCRCASPQLPPRQESRWAILITHILDQQTWYRHRTSCIDTCRRGLADRILDDHQHLDACLQLLRPGESPICPDYKVSQDMKDEIEGLISAEEYLPSCKICHNLTKDRWRSQSLWMSKDVNLLAHHMTSKHGMMLKKDLLIFTHYR